MDEFAIAVTGLSGLVVAAGVLGLAFIGPPSWWPGQRSHAGKTSRDRYRTIRRRALSAVGR